MKGILIEPAEIKDTAKNIFIMANRFNLENEKHVSMLEVAWEVEETVVDQIEIKCIWDEFTEISLCNNEMIINGVAVLCNAFQQLNISNIKHVLGYMMTLGEIECTDEDDLLTQLYVHNWGMAYAEAASHALKAKVSQEYSGLHIFEAAPGFYGMEVSELQSLFKIMDYKRIGIGINEHNVMSPAKTCAGFYLVMDDLNQIPNDSCSDCMGNRKNCSYCVKGRGKC